LSTGGRGMDCRVDDVMRTVDHADSSHALDTNPSRVTCFHGGECVGTTQVTDIHTKSTAPHNVGSLSLTMDTGGASSTTGFGGDFSSHSFPKSIPTITTILFRVMESSLNQNKGECFVREIDKGALDARMSRLKVHDQGTTATKPRLAARV
nr:hypothetical protein [Tanacetum cinerariifolium]